MVSDTNYQLCLPVLRDGALDEEAKIEKLENLLSEQTSLRGPTLENAVLDSLWKYREGNSSSPAPAPVRHTVVRRPSPAPWQLQRPLTPSGLSSANPTSPALPGLSAGRPAFIRAKSMGASPFTSPKASPRPAFSSPQIPHSPSLQSYEFLSEAAPAPAPNTYGDLGSENVDWIVNDGLTSSAISVTSGAENRYSGGASDYFQPHPHQADMSPYDILRSVLGEGRSDAEIEEALQANAFDMGATINALIERTADSSMPTEPPAQRDSSILIGKSMAFNPSRPTTPSASQKNGVVCKYWLSTGQCLRADCKFSHDLSNQICKYWIMGNCLAGDTCIFSHDPANLVNRLTVNDDPVVDSPQYQSFDSQDLSLFPTLQHTTQENLGSTLRPQKDYGFPNSQHSDTLAPPPGFRLNRQLLSESRRNRSRSRSREVKTTAPSVDDTDAFPSLGVHASKEGNKHNRRSDESHDTGPSTLADVVRLSSSPAGSPSRKPLRSNKSHTNTREGSLAANFIPPPNNIPWLATGTATNQAYMKARQEAIKHGGLRNKFLQSAAQAWNRNDSRAAKALSLRGQSENDLMRKAHREAARQLYEERNRNRSLYSEIYVDLHGLHPEEAVEYLERALLDQQRSGEYVYAITGTGHHSRNGKDKVGKAIRGFLNEWRYAYREFSVPGDRHQNGGILGIDPASYDKRLDTGGRVDAGALVPGGSAAGGPESLEELPSSSQVKVTLIREPTRGPSRRE